MLNRKVPMRKCIALNESFPKQELIRVVRTKEGEVFVDRKGKMNGRGAYLSKKKEAIDLAKRKKLLDSKLEVNIPDSIYEELYSIIGE